MTRAILGLGSLFLALGCSSQGPSTQATNIDRSDTKPADLRIRAKVGDTGRYHAVSEMRTEDKGHLHWEVSWDEMAIKVDEESSTWRVTFHDMKVEATGAFKEKGESIKALEGIETEGRFGPLGHDLDGEGASGAAANITFPGRPIRPGDSWDDEIDSNGQVVRMRYTFVRRLTEKRRPAVLIEGTAVDGQSIKSPTPGRYVIDEETGRVISAKVEYEVAVAKLKMSFEVTRIAG